MSKANDTSKFTGIYLSTYTYRNSLKNKDLESKHYMRVLTKGNELIMESIPELNDSYMLARFSVDGSVVTGSWETSTSPQGDYQGVMYYGAAQLIASDDGRHLEGKWVGFGKNMEVKTGPWSFEYVAENVSDVHEKVIGQ